MAYCTVAQVRQYLGLTDAGDDPLISELIDRAGKAIDNHTRRVFESTADATRSFTVGVDTIDRDLWLDEDLASITTVTTNADAATSTTISSSEYVTFPRNVTPYYKIRLLASSSNDWTYTTDPEGGVTIAGAWAYSTSAPDDIVHACVRLAAYFYRQKDAGVFDVTAFPDAGVITVPEIGRAHV